ncbi:hypothetical protein IEQ34_003648 [Dendrobium chrysotoxum]|uniref:Uncharacterized protein n=1 Tax=Dendrobium chrysotoxum TaxID=161865 RepID=A0AAV7GWZ5_DENCH|nr:hypothetical protein IEQ34_003648 [Dendrobium chrysotoxum]
MSEEAEGKRRETGEMDPHPQHKPGPTGLPLSTSPLDVSGTYHPGATAAYPPPASGVYPPVAAASLPPPPVQVPYPTGPPYYTQSYEINPGRRPLNMLDAVPFTHEVVKAVQAPRTMEVDGSRRSTLIDDVSLSITSDGLIIIRKKYHLPNDLVMVAPKKTDRARDPPNGFITVYEMALRAGDAAKIAQTTAIKIERLPCWGLGFGWFLFIIGFFLAAIPWYVGAFIILFIEVDYREKPGYIACSIASVLAAIAAFFGLIQEAAGW